MIAVRFVFWLNILLAPSLSEASSSALADEYKIRNADLLTEEQAGQLQAAYDEVAKDMIEMTAHAIGRQMRYDGPGRRRPDFVPAGLAVGQLIDVGEPGADNRFNGANANKMEAMLVERVTAFWNGNPEKHTGYMTAGGSESNTVAVVVGRKLFPNAAFLYNKEAHYSVTKAFQVAGVNASNVFAVEVDQGENMQLGSLADTLRDIRKKQFSSVVLFLACGTTFREGQDNIKEVMQMLDYYGYRPGSRYVHVDAAGSGFYLPAYKNGNRDRVPSFEYGVNSITASAHKYPGSYAVGSVLIGEADMLHHFGRHIEYVGAVDFTLSCSRDVQAVLYLYGYFFYYDSLGNLSELIEDGIARAKRLVRELTEAGVPNVGRNPDGITVWFPQPAESICRKYMLTSQRGESHVLMLPKADDTLMREFVQDYLGQWMKEM